MTEQNDPENTHLWKFIAQNVKKTIDSDEYYDAKAPKHHKKPEKSKKSQKIAKKQKKITFSNITTSKPHDNNQKKEHSPAFIAPQQHITADESANQIDKRNLQRLQRGQMPIDGQLDLHGMHLHQARDAVIHFITQSYYSDRRCLLIITGKGRRHHSIFDAAFGSSEGKIKSQLPHWLHDPACRPYVLKHVPAQQRHGGTGAFYVLLRRQRG